MQQFSWLILQNIATTTLTGILLKSSCDELISFNLFFNL